MSAICRRLAAVMWRRNRRRDVQSARLTSRAPESAPAPHGGNFLTQPCAREGDEHGMKGKMVGLVSNVPKVPKPSW